MQTNNTVDQHSRSRKINENFYSLQVHGKSTDRNFLLVQLFFFAVISPVFFFLVMVRIFFLSSLSFLPLQTSYISKMGLLDKDDA